MRTEAGTPSLRHSLYCELDPSARAKTGLSLTNRVVGLLIIASAALAVLETEPVVTAGRQIWFTAFEWLATVAFAIEYAARVWVSVENPKYGRGAAGRFKYVTSPAAVMDLLAVAPILLTFAGSETFLLRLFRLVRILRLARLGRFSSAMHELTNAIRSRRHELALSVALGLMLLLGSSTMLYLIEGPVQPEQFGSIPRSMWWSVMTLTTVGYGDVYPVSSLGRAFAALTAVFGIGLIAMPTGILAAAFSDAMRHRNVSDSESASRRD
jgi:voltage-gated potassium channel